MALTPIQKDFAKFLANIWAREENSGLIGLPNISIDSCNSSLAHSVFFHQYKITKDRAWHMWKPTNTTGSQSQGHGYHQQRQVSWWCNSLGEAAIHYSWRASPVGTFTSLATGLQAAMSANNQVATANICRDIFLWGGVAQKPTDPSRLWVDKHEKGNTLIKNIQDAVVLLTSGCTTPLSTFNGINLLMNSAMTKVYAAANPSSIIIYDGRVGAAFGLLTRLFLVAKGIHNVPSDLAFLWGPSRTNPSSRDPSLASYKFKKLNGDYDRANIARIAGEILSENKNILSNLGITVQMHDLEKALFMIGYRVR